MPSYDLKKLSSKELLSNLKALVVRDRQLTSNVLAHIAEVDARGLFLESACASMFSYCLSRLNMSESCAYNSIAAARAARRFPAIYKLVESGELHLTTVKLLAPRLTSENHHELLDAAKNLSRRGVERLIASRFPNPDVATSMRKLPPPRRRAEPVTATVAPASGVTPSADRASPSTAPISTPSSAPSPPAPDQVPQTLLPPTSSGHAEVRPLSETRYCLKLTMSSGMHDKLLRAQELMRHRLPGGELDTVLDRALDALLRELEHSKFGATSRPRKKVKPPRKGSRHIPSAIKREVAARDEHRCTFVDDEGRRCEERAWLEFDHIRPAARGGTARTAAAVRLLCRAHNRHAAEKAFGKDFMRRKVAEARRRREAAQGAARDADRLVPGPAPVQPTAAGRSVGPRPTPRRVGTEPERAPAGPQPAGAHTPRKAPKRVGPKTRPVAQRRR